VRERGAPARLATGLANVCLLRVTSHVDGFSKALASTREFASSRRVVHEPALSKLQRRWDRVRSPDGRSDGRSFVRACTATSDQLPKLHIRLQKINLQLRTWHWESKTCNIEITPSLSPTSVLHTLSPPPCLPSPTTRRRPRRSPQARLPRRRE
jgi:hypothetical protein